MNLPSIIQKLNAYERLMRLDKPIGILLLLWPTLWGLLIAGQGKPNWQIVLVFVTGTVLMRSAGCVLNDIADRNFDGHVDRTKARPLATQEVSVKEAYILAGLLTIIAFVLVCFLNIKTINLSIAALFLAITYPYTKRFIHLPQAYLGVAFGFGIPMAFAAINNQIPPVAWWLLLANVFWSIAYDTEYAMVDKEDDIKIGIKSSAIFFGRYTVSAVMICYLCMLIILTYVGQVMGLGQYYFLSLALVVLLVVKQYQLIKNGFKANCFKAFKQNAWIGFAICFGFVLALTV